MAKAPSVTASKIGFTLTLKGLVENRKEEAELKRVIESSVWVYSVRVLRDPLTGIRIFEVCLNSGNIVGAEARTRVLADIQNHYHRHQPGTTILFDEQ